MLKTKMDFLNNPDLVMKASVLWIALLIILSRTVKNPENVFYFIISGIVSYFFFVNYNEKNQNENQNEKLYSILNKNETIFSSYQNSVLYKNPELVKVFINLCPFYRFDTKNFKEALTLSNQLVRVHESAKLGHKNPNQTIDIAEELQRSILNHIQSMIHSFPSTVIAGYRFQANLNILQKVLQNIIKDIKNIYDFHYESTGINIINPPPSVRSGEWENPVKSKGYSENWNFYY